jgi:tRNA A-37 threonylcarbamoyl transferase component Bud32
LTPQQLPKPGDVVGGKYRIERTVGNGGMSVVFEVSHRITDKRFAVKWMLPEDSADADMVKRFVREAKVAGRCQHPNIVEVYDIDQDGGAFFIVMELLEGESLARRLDRVGRLSVSETCRLLLPCMEALSVAHAAGIVHRDLKPANIFVCAARGREPERAKLLDFGVSQFATLPGAISATHTKRGAVLGTPLYMPVEQLRGQRVDHRIDVYALGVTLFETLSGQRPFQAERYVDLVLKIAEQEPPSLHALVPGLPRGLVEIVMRAMAREADARFASVAELHLALQPYQYGFEGSFALPGAAAQVPVNQQTIETPLAGESTARHWEARSASTRRWRWLALAVLSLLLAALAWLGSRRSEREPQPPTAAKVPVSASDGQREGAQGGPAAAPVQPQAPLEPVNSVPPPAAAAAMALETAEPAPAAAPSPALGVAPTPAPTPSAAPTPDAVPTPSAPPAPRATPVQVTAPQPVQVRKPSELRSPEQTAEANKPASKPPAQRAAPPAAASHESVAPEPASEPAPRHSKEPTPVPLDRSEF